MSKPTHILRRGLSQMSFVLTAAAVTAVGLSTAVITPRLLRADAGPGGQRAAVAEHQQLIDGLAELIGRSVEVLAVHPRAEGRRFTEVLLWVGDAENPGVPDLAELGLISHSDVLQTITFVTWPKEEPVPWRFEDLSHELLREPSFCEALRTNPVVSSRLIGRGVSDMRCWWTGRSEGGPRLWISLKWASLSADPPDEASAGVDAVVRPDVVRGVMNHE